MTRKAEVVESKVRGSKAVESTTTFASLVERYLHQDMQYAPCLPIYHICLSNKGIKFFKLSFASTEN